MLYLNETRNEGWQFRAIEEADWFGGGTAGGSGQNRTVYMSTNYDKILKYTSSRSALDYFLHSTHFFHKVYGNGPLYSAISGEIG